MTLLLLLLALPVNSIDDPLAPARQGQLQCHSPDVARKTCAALAGYTFEADGRIHNQAEVLLSRSPAVVMHNETTVFIREGAVCGDMSDLAKASFTIGGQAPDENVTNLLRTQVTAAFSQLGREGCTRYAPNGEGIFAKVTIDGEERPDLNQPVMWVSPDAGWSVAP